MAITFDPNNPWHVAVRGTHPDVFTGAPAQQAQAQQLRQPPGAPLGGNPQAIGGSPTPVKQSQKPAAPRPAARAPTGDNWYDNLNVPMGADGLPELGWRKTSQQGRDAGFLSAKDANYKAPGSIASQYGWTPDTVFPTIRNYLRGDDKGSKKAVEMLRASDSKGNPAQSKLLNQFMDTGVAPEGLDRSWVLEQMDHQYRRVSKDQQTKKPSLLSKLAKVALSIGPSFIPGVGPIVGGALGGGLSSLINNDDGVLGVLKGAGIGAATGWAGDKLGKAWNANKAVPKGTNPSGAAANAVPGGSSGIHGATGGGLVGSGQLNPAALTLAGSGGANIGWNPFAVLGGAAAKSAGVQATADILRQNIGKKVPGTNQIVGGEKTLADKAKGALAGASSAVKQSLPIATKVAGAAAGAFGPDLLPKPPGPSDEHVDPYFDPGILKHGHQHSSFKSGRKGAKRLRENPVRARGYNKAKDKKTFTEEYV